MTVTSRGHRRIVRHADERIHRDAGDLPIFGQQRDGVHASQQATVVILRLVRQPARGQPIFELENPLRVVDRVAQPKIVKGLRRRRFNRVVGHAPEPQRDRENVFQMFKAPRLEALPFVRQEHLSPIAEGRTILSHWDVDAGRLVAQLLADAVLDAQRVFAVRLERVVDVAPPGNQKSKVKLFRPLPL